MWSLTDKRSTLVASLDTYFYTKDSGQYFERLTYPDVFIILWTEDFKSCSFWRKTLKFWETSMWTIWNRFGNTWGNWRPYFLDRNMFLASFKQLLVAYLIMISPMIMVDLIIQNIRYFLEFLQRSRLSVLRDYQRVQYFLVRWILIATL